MFVTKKIILDVSFLVFMTLQQLVLKCIALSLFGSFGVRSGCFATPVNSFFYPCFLTTR